MQRLEIASDVEVDALVQVEEFVVNLAIALVGLEEFHVRTRSIATLKSGKTDVLLRAGPDPGAVTGVTDNQGPAAPLDRERRDDVDGEVGEPDGHGLSVAADLGRRVLLP